MMGVNDCALCAECGEWAPGVEWGAFTFAGSSMLGWLCADCVAFVNGGGAGLVLDVVPYQSVFIMPARGYVSVVRDD